jgi:hypothetical protein
MWPPLSGVCQERQIVQNDNIMCNPNCFLIVLKPEVTVSPAAERLVMDLLRAHDVTVRRRRPVPGDVVRREGVYRALYRELAAVAAEGLPRLTPTVRDAGAAHFGARWTERGVLSADQVLAADPSTTPLSLRRLTTGPDTVKLAANTYATPMVLDGDDIVVLNAFVPFQRAWLEDPARALLLCECVTDMGWPAVRRDVIGFFDPARAERRSIRGALSARQHELGLRDPIGIAYNGVHVSPGPLEAMFQLSALFDGGRPPDDAPLAAALRAAGVAPEAVRALEANPIVPGIAAGRKAFDATEDLDSGEAVRLLAAALA